MEEIEGKVPSRLISLLEDSIAPLTISYFSPIDKYLNLKCHFSNFTKYNQNEVYSVYNIKSVLRVLLLKSGIVEEQTIEEVFKVDSDEFCVVLGDNDSSDFLVFSTEKLTTFKDQQLIKMISKNLNEIASEMEKLK